MVQDEGLFGRISSLGRSWAPPGIRPEVAKQLIRKAIYVFCAVAPALGKISSLILPACNKEMMALFLENVSQEFNDSFIVMQVDRAGWHVSQHLNIPENIRLLPQPAKSPEVNPVEHIWDDIREKFFHNEFFNSLNEVMDRLCEALNALAASPEKITSMTYFPHLRCTF